MNIGPALALLNDLRKLRTTNAEGGHAGRWNALRARAGCQRYWETRFSVDGGSDRSERSGRVSKCDSKQGIVLCPQSGQFNRALVLAIERHQLGLVTLLDGVDQHLLLGVPHHLAELVEVHVVALLRIPVCAPDHGSDC